MSMSWKQSMEWKHTDSPVNKRYWVQQSVKKVTLIVFYDMKRPLIIDFLENSSTVNSYSYYQLLRWNSPYLLNNPFMEYLWITITYMHISLNNIDMFCLHIFVYVLSSCWTDFAWWNSHTLLLPLYFLPNLGPSSGVCILQKQCDLCMYITTL